MGKLTAVIVPTYGNHELTHELVADVIREANDYDLRLIVVDNHSPADADSDFFNAEGPYGAADSEIVLRPGSNLKWARSFNLGARYAIDEWGDDCDAFVVLDNDTRLSPGFFNGLRTTWDQTGAYLVCPLYNHNGDWTHQWSEYDGTAIDYEAINVSRAVPFANKCAIYIPRSTYELIGPLDVELAPRYGWAIDIDYAMKVRAAGSQVRVTELSYMTHRRAATNAMIEYRYFENADSEFRIAMSSRYGTDWVHRVWDGFPLPDSYEELMGFVS